MGGGAPLSTRHQERIFTCGRSCREQLSAGQGGPHREERSTQTQDPAPPNCREHPAQKCLTQIRTRQEHKPSHQQTGFPRPPQGLRTTPVTSHQNMRTSPCRREAYTGHWTSLTARGQRPDLRRELWPSNRSRGDLKHSKLDKTKRWEILCK